MELNGQECPVGWTPKPIGILLMSFGILGGLSW
jgi:hypothetical protein